MNKKAAEHSEHEHPKKRLRISRKWAVGGLVCLIVLLVVGGVLGWRVARRRQLAQRDRSLEEARAAVQNAKYAEAETDFQKALAVPGLPVTVWRELGLAYQMDRKQPQAIDAYQRSLAGEPNDAFTWNVLGNLYRDAGQYPQAEAAYQRSISEDSRLQIVVINLGHLYILEGKSAQAITFLTQHYDGSRAQEEVGLQLASVYLQLGKRDEAGHILQSVLGTDPTNARAKSMASTL
jgi:Flp pilus assembly protein TadD